MWILTQHPDGTVPPPLRPLFSGSDPLRHPRTPKPGRARAALGRPPATLRADQHAFFLDFDGTLIEYAPQPNAVTVDAGLLELLRQLEQRSGGAIALVSGRSIASLDAFLAPLELPASGLHGFERRGATGVYTQHARPSRQTLAAARQLMAQLARMDPRLTLEDKGYVVALHYRQVPYLEGAILEALERIVDLTDGDLQVLHGMMSLELVPPGVSKATAIAEFMRERPFRGRRPLSVGDDASDESGFEWVNEAGGLSVAVRGTRPTAARTGLPSVSAVRAWLRGLIEGPG